MQHRQGSSLSNADTYAVLVVRSKSLESDSY